MAHLSADNFAVLAPRKDWEKKLVAIEKEFQMLLDDHSVTLKAGITLYEKLSAKSRQNPRHSFDTAKIAADSIKQDASRVYAYYTEDMGRQLLDEAYVLRNFETALQGGSSPSLTFMSLNRWANSFVSKWRISVRSCAWPRTSASIHWPKAWRHHHRSRTRDVSGQETSAQIK